MAKQGALSGMNQGGLTELWGRLRFLFLAIIVYRIGAHIPVPGINPDRLADMFRQNEGTILSLFNMFSGGALERMSIFALGIMPYISASLIMQKKEGESGRRKISQYTRYLTLVLALVQAVGMSVGLASQGVAFANDFGFYFIAVTTFVAGAMFMMWLGEQITERGVGNGISMLIFAGIVAGLPGAIGQSFEAARQGDINIFALIAIAQGVCCPDQSLAVEGEHGRCNSGDFRQQHPVVPGLAGNLVRSGRRYGLAAEPVPGHCPGSAVEHHSVQCRDHILLLLLYSADVQPEGRC